MSTFEVEFDAISRISIVIYDSIFAKKQSLRLLWLSNYMSLNSFEKSCSSIKQVKHSTCEANKAMKSILTTFILNLCSTCHIEKSTLMLSLIYLDRIFLKQPDNFNIDDLLEVVIGCIIVAIKYNQDYYFLKTLDAITSIKFHHLINIETWALEALDYSLYVDIITYNTYAHHLANFGKSI